MWNQSSTLGSLLVISMELGSVLGMRNFGESSWASQIAKYIKDETASTHLFHDFLAPWAHQDSQMCFLLIADLSRCLRLLGLRQPLELVTVLSLCGLQIS